MWIQMLGPMTVELGSRAGTNLGGPKQRTVLALLALRANRTVGVEELINEVWEDDPPGRPRKTLQVYIANLRRELGADRIASGAFGYQLHASDDQLDARRFDALVERARSRSDSDPRAAIADYEAALDLWSADRPLADLLSCAAVARLVRPLEEARADVVEELMTLRIHHGAAALAVAALPDLIAADPWRERLWALLMEGLYVTGRQVEALDAYQRVRNLMIDELGVEPGPELRDLERRILAQDPSLEVAAASPPAAVEPTVADERRTVTFVSIGLVDDALMAELDPEDLAELLDRARARISTIVEAHGGQVAQAGGESVLASFGYPNASEDDPQQAVRAALAACAGDAARCAGVHTGLALFRGSPPVAAGQAPAIAARMQRVARPGEVLASSETAPLVNTLFSLSPLGRPVSLPGELGAVVVAGELPPVGDDLQPVVLAGRTAELARLRALDETREPTVAAVIGEPGIGKTSLVGGYLGGLGPAAAGVLVLRADRHRRSQSLYPIGQLLAGRYADADELALELDLLGVPQPALGETVRVLADLAGWSSSSAQPPVLSVTARRSAVTTWLAALGSTRPLRLIVEDLGFLDAETTAAVDALADELNQGLILVTTREPELPPGLAARAERIELDRLPTDDARTLVVRAAAPARLRLSTVNEILRLGDGHPLHLRELARHAASRPRGRRGDDVPATLQASLLARLDRLGPAKGLVQRCTVIGDEFDVELARLVCADADLGPGPGLSERLDALADEGVLRRIGPPDHPRYRFAHALLEDVGYASLPRAVRTELHQRIAAQLAAAGRPEDALFAEHLEAAGQAPQAAVGWVRAAEVASTATRFAEASAYARRALADLALLPPGPERDRLTVMAKLLLASSIKMTVISDDELVETTLSAFALAEESGNVALKARFYPVLISTLQAIGRYDEAALRGAEAVALAQAVGNPILEHRSRQFHASTLTWMGKLAEADAVYEPNDAATHDDSQLSLLLRAAEVLSDCAGLALAGLAQTTRGRREEGEALFERALRRATEASAPESICLVSATYGIARQLLGDSAGTRSAAERTIELCVQLGNDWWFVWAQALLGWSVAADGNAAEGLAMVLEAIEHAGDVQQLLPYFNALAARAELESGRPEEALARLRSAVATAERTGEGFFLPYIQLVTADALAAVGAPGDEVEHQHRLATELALAQGQQLFVDRVAGAR